MILNQQLERLGFTRVDLLILAALAAVAAVLVPLLPRNHRHDSRAPRIACVNNLKQVGLAYRQWAIDNNDKFPMEVSATNGGAMEMIEGGDVYLNFLVMSNELVTPKILFCPADDRRVWATTFAQSLPPNATPTAVTFASNNISYFVGLDADETNPGSFISGDDNVMIDRSKPKPGILSLWTNSPVAWTKERHASQGNVGLADGSVIGVSTPRLREALVVTGMATNRLVIP